MEIEVLIFVELSTGEKISLALKGKRKSPEHIEKVRLANLGKKRTAEQRRRMSESHLGSVLSAVTRKKLSVATSTAHRDGRIPSLTLDAQEKGRKKSSMLVGPLHPNWISDRSTLARRNQQRTAADLTWSNTVRRRDKWKCALSSPECCGRLEAHHIEPWKDSPDLRYDVDNGITLCQFHHPRKQSKVTELASKFKSIVEARKGSN